MGITRDNRQRYQWDESGTSERPKKGVAKENDCLRPHGQRTGRRGQSKRNCGRKSSCGCSAASFDFRSSLSKDRRKGTQTRKRDTELVGVQCRLGFARSV